MNFEKEMEKLHKLEKSGDVNLQKHHDKMAEIMSRYSATHNMEINNARKQYEWTFDFYCREAGKSNMDLWGCLSTKFIKPEERHLIKPPDTLKKEEQKLWIKKEIWPYYYEWFINGVMAAFMNELSELKKLNSGGGKGTVKITRKRRIAKEEKIRKKIKELIALGKISPSIKRGDITTIAKALKFEYNYVQEYMKLQKRNESPKC